MDLRIEIIKSTIQNEYYRGLHLRDLARAVNLSTSRLRHLFKEHIGQTLFQYLLLTRMQQAKVLLETTPLRVKEVMTRVGISDDSHFTRDFKRFYGLAPSKYRNRYLSQRLAPRDGNSRQQTVTSAKNSRLTRHWAPTKISIRKHLLFLILLSSSAQ